MAPVSPLTFRQGPVDKCGRLTRFRSSQTIPAKAPMQVSVLKPLSTANLVFSATWGVAKGVGDRYQHGHGGLTHLYK